MSPGRRPISLEDFKARVPLVDIVARYVRLVRRGREHVGLCPFHKEKTPSFTVSDGKGFFHCFGCGRHGNAIDFVMAMEGLEFGEALQRLSELTGIPAPQGRASGPAVDRTLLRANEAAARWFAGRLEGAAGEEARAYLQRRGLDANTIARFCLGYAPPERFALKRALLAEGFLEAQLIEAGLLVAPEDGSASYDRFRHRVMFPIHDARGRIVGFGGRALGEAKAKYLNTPETPLFHKGELLYGYARAREAARQHGTVVIAEGYMDVIALARAGFANAVAPLGTAISETQLELLWRLADEPIVCLDGDEAGLRAAHRLMERALPLLRPGKSLRFAVLPQGQDPDSLLRSAGLQALAARLQESQHFLEFLWSQETAGLNLAAPERRAALDRRFRELAGRINDRDLARRVLGALFRRTRAAFDQPARPGAPRHETSPLARRHEQSVGAAQLAERLQRAENAMECELLAPIIAHPELLGELEEELAALHFEDGELEVMRERIISWYAHEGHLDPTGLSAHLSTTGFAGLVERLLGGGSVAPWYGRNDVPLSSVRDGWRARVAQHRLCVERRALAEATERAIAGQQEHELRAHLKAVDRLLNKASRTVRD